MNLSAENLCNPDRDRLVLCKGHAAPMLYCNLIEKGILPSDSLSSLRRLNSELQGHPCSHTPGGEMSAGPQGLGLGAAEGMAMGLKLDGSKARVYAVLGDGELNEGAVWEAAGSCVKYRLSNLTAIVDWNKLQLDGPVEQVMPQKDIPGKWRAFGWNVLSCDGHDLASLDKALDEAAAFTEGPSVIIADTVKGKGVSFMEGNYDWHGKAIDDKSFLSAMAELRGEKNA
jgi:transketolase